MKGEGKERGSQGEMGEQQCGRENGEKESRERERWEGEQEWERKASKQISEDGKGRVVDGDGTPSGGETGG